MSSVVRNLSILQEPLFFEMLFSAFVLKVSLENHSCEFVDIPVLCWCYYGRKHTDMVNININVVNRKWNINCVTIWLFLLHIIDLLVLYHHLYCFDKQYIIFVLMFLLFFWLYCNSSLHQLLHWQAMFQFWFNLIVPVVFIRLHAWLMPVMQLMYIGATIVAC